MSNQQWSNLTVDVIICAPTAAMKNCVDENGDGRGCVDENGDGRGCVGGNGDGRWCVGGNGDGRGCVDGNGDGRGCVVIKAFVTKKTTKKISVRHEVSLFLYTRFIVNVIIRILHVDDTMVTRA